MRKPKQKKLPPLTSKQRCMQYLLGKDDVEIRRYPEDAWEPLIVTRGEAIGMLRHVTENSAPYMSMDLRLQLTRALFAERDRIWNELISPKRTGTGN